MIVKFYFFGGVVVFVLIFVGCDVVCMFGVDVLVEIDVLVIDVEILVVDDVVLVDNLLLQDWDMFYGVLFFVDIVEEDYLLVIDFVIVEL